MTRWVTIKKAAELTGLPDTFFDERTGRSGRWPESVVWKRFEGRKMIDSQALDEFIDGNSSPPSTRGRKKAARPGATAASAEQISLPPFLLAAELADLCAPITQGSAQTRHPCALLGVSELPRRPDGTPIVSRKLVEERLNRGTGAQPDQGFQWTK